MTRAGWLLVGLVGLVGRPTPVSADAPSRKPGSTQVTKAARDAFARAIAADEAGDHKLAIELYRHAFKISPHPNPAYNLADVLQRDSQLNDAAHYFETYLALSPKAPDREAVAATIEALRTTPGTIYIHEPDADDRSDDTFRFDSSYIFLDGKLVAKPGTKPVKTPARVQPVLAIKVPAGRYIADAISAISYDQVIKNHCKVGPGRETQCLPRLPHLVDGNVVVSSNEDREFRVKLEGHQWDLIGRRTAFPPGKTWIAVSDRSFQCAPILVDAPADDPVRYIFLRVTENFLPPRCRAFTVEQHLLKF